MQINNSLAFFLGLAATASAHMKMREPQPWFSNNSPLDPEGKDFPCKGVAYDNSVPRTSIQKGQSSPLKFTGSAVHGGGSCQISLTTDLSPTKNSVWKVIKTFEGGCPARNQAGNYAENAEFLTPDEYDFVIPEGVPAGQYTLAWTWFNNVGNREMYMNCAPAEAVGSGGDESFFNDLPNMFVANIGNGCGTKPNTDLDIPNKGSVVEKAGSLANLAGPTGSCDAPVGGGNPPAQTPTPSNPGGVFIEQPEDDVAEPVVDEPAYTPAPTPSPSPAPAEPIQDAPVVDEPKTEPAPDYEVPANNGSDGGSGSGFAQGTACANEGYWNCIGGTSFQRCASGTWSAPQAVSSGTKCTAGVSDVIQVSKRGTVRFGAKFLV